MNLRETQNPYGSEAQDFKWEPEVSNSKNKEKQGKKNHHEIDQDKEKRAESESSGEEFVAEDIGKNVAENLSDIPGIDNEQKEVFENNDFQEMAEDQAAKTSFFGERLSKFGKILKGVGIGAGVRIATRQAANVILPGAGAAIGGFTGGISESILKYRNERIRVKETNEYLKENKDNESLDLAARYIELANDLEKNPGQLGKQFELLDLAEKIQVVELKDVRGADLIKEHIKIRNSAEQEVLRTDKQNAKILDLLQAQYSTKVNKAAVVKAASRGAALGVLGVTLGTLAASFFAAESVAAAAKDFKDVAKEVKQAVPDVINMDKNIWSTAKEFLKSQGIEGTNENVLKAAKRIAMENDIKVEDWVETKGVIKDTAMNKGFPLRGFGKVLEDFGKEVPAGADVVLGIENLGPDLNSGVAETVSHAPNPLEGSTPLPGAASGISQDYSTLQKAGILLGFGAAVGGAGYMMRNTVSPYAERFAKKVNNYGNKARNAYQDLRDKRRNKKNTSSAESESEKQAREKQANEQAQQARQREQEERNRQSKEKSDAENKRKAEEAKKKSEAKNKKTHSASGGSADSGSANESKDTTQNSKGPEKNKEAGPKLTKLPDFNPKSPNAELEAMRILGVSMEKKGKGPAIKKHYKAATIKNHPDKYGQWPEIEKIAEHNLKQINIAMAFLKKKYNFA